MKRRPAWWPTAEQKRHADAGCKHPDECRVTEDEPCPSCGGTCIPPVCDYPGLPPVRTDRPES